MEEQKYLKRKKKALNGSNRRLLAEVCSELGDYYNKKRKYEEALKEYEECSNVYSEIGPRSQYGLACRMVGEMHMFMGDFEKALRFENIYLSISKESNNKTEQQRAYATLGRIHLLQGQSIEDSLSSKKSLNSALKAFMKSLTICESLKGKISNQELMDMKARLLLNIGVVSEYLGDFGEAVEFLQKAISICKKHDLYELLAQCHITEGLLHSSKHSDHAKAISCFNLAFEVASRLENKIAKQCEILLLKAEAHCKMSDFQSAKIILMKAWKMNSPNADDKVEIEKTLKIVAALCYTEDSIITTSLTDYANLKNLYEKMGDGACSLKNYEKAIYYYLKMLENAEKNGESDKELIPIYVSLYQTYKDLKQYEMAIVYIKKEYEIVKDQPNEAFSILLQLADFFKLSNRMTDFEESLLKAEKEAVKSSNMKQHKKCLLLLQKYYEEYDQIEKLVEIKTKLDELLIRSPLGSSSEEEFDENSPNIGDDICLDDLTDLSVNEDSEEIQKNSTRKRGKGFTIKKNSKGETQLHQACISGNTLLVTRLISQGHPINVRDNAGWLPIHEACIHGNKSVVEILLKNGAHVNDRGGVQCDGITPLYDAACNGHLEIIDILLENGASPLLKTDYGETALEILKKWQRKADKSSYDNVYYETICAKLAKSTKISDRSTDNIDCTVDIVKNSKISPNKTESISSSKCLRRNAIESDDSLDSIGKDVQMPMYASSDSNSPKLQSKKQKILQDSSNSDNESSSNSGVNQYKNAINALRNRPFNKNKSVNEEKKLKKMALLDSEEVGEDWLENDILSRKRRQSNDIFNPSKRKSNEETLRSYDDNSLDAFINVNNIEETVLNNVIDKNINKSQNANDLNEINQSILSIENISPNTTVNTLKPMKGVAGIKSRKFKRQISLTKAGFVREKVNKNKNDTEFQSFDLSEEPDSTTELSSSPVLQTFRNITERAHSNAPNSTYKATPLIPVKVKIQDKLFLIPINSEKLDSFTVRWLINEASKRYYSTEGVQPSIQLSTNDGAILDPNDPLNIVQSSTEFIGNIISWNLPPLGDRYVECCSQLSFAMDNHIKSKLETSQATHILQMSDMNLTLDEMKPIFKALNHQSNMQSLVLSNNSIGNDGVKCLTQCLPSLINISYLNISNNNIDHEGIKHFVLMFEKGDLNVCRYLKKLDLSFNPISDLGFGYIMKILKHLNIKSLNLKACDITSYQTQSMENLKLHDIEDVDLSYNNISRIHLKEISDCISYETCVSMSLQGIKLSGMPSQLFHCQYSNLVKINVSRCDLLDSDVNELLRSLLRCSHLEEITADYNADLTFYSFKNFIQHNNLKRLSLEGCSNIFLNIQSSDLQGSIFLDREIKLEWLRITPADEKNVKNIIDSLSMMWENYWSFRGVVHVGIYNEVIFKLEK